MNLRTIVTTGSLLASLAFVPAPAAADDVAICGLDCITPACPQFGIGSGGVVGATIDYANEMLLITCAGAAQEASIVLSTSEAACQATLAYAIGSSGCAIIVCNICATEASGEAGSVDADLGSWCCLPPTIRCAPPGPAGPGVIPQTLGYAETMAFLGCQAAVASGAVAVQAVFAYCGATGDYLVGNPYACTFYWAA